MSTQSQELILKELKKQPKFADLKEPNSEFSVYDYYNDNCLVEIKDRYNTNYPTTMLEESKYKSLLEEAKGRTIFYAVKDAKGITLFDLTNTPLPPLSELWCSKTTEFNNKNKVNKPCYLLDFKDGTKV